MGLCSIGENSRPDLLAVLVRIEQRGAFTTAEKCRTWFNQLFRFAMVKVPALQHNPASDLDVRHLLSHRSNLGQRISENTLNGALRRMGYVDQLTGHGIRATLSTALHEIDYPQAVD